MSDSRNSRQGGKRRSRCTCWLCTDPAYKFKVLRERADSEDVVSEVRAVLDEFADGPNPCAMGDCYCEDLAELWREETLTRLEIEPSAFARPPLRVPFIQVARVR